jgi:hypothetical protein
MAQPETHQLLRRDRLGADLLASQPQCRNLFGELAADLELAGGGWPRPPIALAPHPVTAAIGVALPPAAARGYRR